MDTTRTEVPSNDADFDWADWTVEQQDTGSVFDTPDDVWG